MRTNVDHRLQIWQSLFMFVALDVETANRNWVSICQIGMVLFERGQAVEEFQTLINPQARFDSGNIRIHGITPEDVRHAPTFEDAANDIFARMAGHIIVAHNAGFDRNAVTYAAADRGLAPPSCRWLCSAKVARRAWHGELERFGLAKMAAHLGINFQHHDALEDARACGHVVTTACDKTGLDVEDWLVRVTQPTNAPNVKPTLPRPPLGEIAQRALAGAQR